MLDEEVGKETSKKQTKAVRQEPKVVSEKKQTKWTAECTSTLPKFSLVREKQKSVEEWSTSVKRVLAEYWGPSGLIVNSLVEVVDLPEFKRTSFVASDYDVSSLLKFIEATWKTKYAAANTEVVLTKKEKQSWGEFLDELENWAVKKGLQPTDQWLLNQMRANLDAASDPFLGKDVQAALWAEQMDILLSVYNRAKQETVSAVSATTEKEASEEESVEAVFKSRGFPRRDHRYTADGRPICDTCHGEGHVARECPNNRKRRNDNRFGGRGGFGRRNERGGRKDFFGNRR